MSDNLLASKGGDTPPTGDDKNFLETKTQEEGSATQTAGDPPTDTPPDANTTPASSNSALPDKSLLPDALKAAGLDETSAKDYLSLIDSKGDDGLILGKYKDVDALIEGFKNLSKKITEKQKSQAPDEYSEDALNGLKFTDEQVTKFKEAGLDDKMLGAVTELLATSILPENKKLAQSNAELHLRASLGFTPEDASYDTYIDGLAKWASENVPEAVVAELQRSSKGVMALVDMRKASVNANNTTQVTANQQSGKDKHEELLQEMQDNWQKYSSDPVYQKNLNDRIQKATNAA